VKRFPSAYSIVPPLLICAGCVAYLFSDLDLTRFWAAWAGFDASYLVIAMLLGILNVLVLGLRLHFLAAAEISLLDSCKAALLGLSLNALLPAKLGEIGKITYLADRSGKTIASTTHLVFWERFLDLHMLLGVIILAIAFGLPAVFSLVAVAAIATLWVGLGIIYTHTEFALRLVRIIPQPTVQRFLSELVEHLSLGIPVSRLIIGAVLSLLPWGIYALQLIFVLQFILAFDLSLTQLLAVLLAASISTSIPVTPGAIGVYEAAIVAVLGQFGIDKAVALSAAIMMHAILYLPVIFGAAWALGMAPKLLPKNR
jgi:uncharacterized protein (TIRG00374 family)